VAATGIASTHDVPTSVNVCQQNSLTLSTSVVISVMICALLENSPASVSEPSDAVSVSVFLFSDGPEDEATSFLASVLAKRIEFNCTRMLTCSVVVERDHIWPLTDTIHFQSLNAGIREDDRRIWRTEVVANMPKE